MQSWALFIWLQWRERSWHYCISHETEIFIALLTESLKLIIPLLKNKWPRTRRLYFWKSFVYICRVRSRQRAIMECLIIIIVWQNKIIVSLWSRNVTRSIIIVGSTNKKFPEYDVSRSKFKRLVRSRPYSDMAFHLACVRYRLFWWKYWKHLLVHIYNKLLWRWLEMLHIKCSSFHLVTPNNIHLSSAGRFRKIIQVNNTLSPIYPIVRVKLSFSS